MRHCIFDMTLSQRRLPHIYTIGEPQFVTFRLHGSLPAGRDFPRDSLTSGRAFVAMDRLLDNARYGPIHLQQPDIAVAVRSAIQHSAGRAYDLHAWVIMPNHVHLLLTPHSQVSAFLRRLKGYSARQANQLLGQTGQRFWQEESYNHCVRSAEEFRRIEGYILANPVKAGLARSVDEYLWSSAAHSD